MCPFDPAPVVAGNPKDGATAASAAEALDSAWEERTAPEVARPTPAPPNGRTLPETEESPTDAFAILPRLSLLSFSGLVTPRPAPPPPPPPILPPKAPPAAAPDVPPRVVPAASGATDVCRERKPPPPLLILLVLPLIELAAERPISRTKIDGEGDCGCRPGVIEAVLCCGDGRDLTHFVRAIGTKGGPQVGIRLR